MTSFTTQVHTVQTDSPSVRLTGIETAPPDASALVPLLLLPAMCQGEDVFIEGGISTRLSESLSTIQDIFGKWVSVKRVRVEGSRGPTTPSGDRCGCFFSGGVDSFFSVLKRADEIDDLIFVHGLDVPLDDTATRQEVGESVRKAAASLGKNLVEFETDIRTWSDRHASWELYHGSALAFIALATGPWSKVFVPSTRSYRDLGPWGSHPMLDPLWSTEATTLVHDGAEASRVEKVARLAGEAAPREHLRVCWQNAGALNCGRCEKCIRTMIALETYGVLEDFVTFPNRVPHYRVPLIWVKDAKTARLVRENLDSSPRQTTRFGLRMSLLLGQPRTLIDRVWRFAARVWRGVKWRTRRMLGWWTS